MFYEPVRDRLIRYAQVNTQSDPLSREVPTTRRQFDLAHLLRDELVRIGADNVHLDESSCVLCADIPASAGQEQAEAFGLVVHMDTSPDAPGAPVRPWVLSGYGGGDIVLNTEKDIFMRPSDFPSLKDYIGQDLVLTDGQTLLGGDDKAGIASVMTFAEHLLSHPEIKHGLICLAFTPDEEVGGLARDLDLARFGAKVAYTLDGDHSGWYMDETFNASQAVLTIAGRSVHTGTAKGIMVNAADIAAAFTAMLPEDERPQTTSGREGFYHVISIEGTCERAVVRMIIRDHDAERFRARENFVRDCAGKLQARYGTDRVSLEIKGQYRNMKEILDRKPYLVERLIKAISAVGLTPRSEPFRGGTDGSALSWRGLPCPNLSAGYENAHGRFEYVPIQSMEKNVEILLKLAEEFAL